MILMERWKECLSWVIFEIATYCFLLAFRGRAFVLGTYAGFGMAGTAFPFSFGIDTRLYWRRVCLALDILLPAVGLFLASYISKVESF
jgi:hypothetical protein